MRLLQTLFGERRARASWEAELRWFRVRYRRAPALRRCLDLLSRPEVCGRLALEFRREESVSQLYLGIPAVHGRLLQRMAADFGFSLRKANISASPAQPLVATDALPWQRSFQAQIVAGQAFVDGVGGNGRFMPSPPEERESPAWTVLQPPPVGLSLAPRWPPDILTDPPVGEEEDGWPLGYTGSGVLWRGARRVNVVGATDAVAHWLRRQLIYLLAHDGDGLMVVDSVGNVVPWLKRRSVVTSRLGKQIHYLNVDGSAVLTGFNPLAQLPGESDTAQVQRWQRWFMGMNVHAQGVALLSDAQKAGVTDVGSLRKWLRKVARRGQVTAAAAVEAALDRLLTERTVREWLTWTQNSLHAFEGGAVLFACRGDSWARRQLLHGFALAVSGNRRLVLHGGPWDFLHAAIWKRPLPLLVSGDSPISAATQLLVNQEGVAVPLRLPDKLSDDAVLAENMLLLSPGEAVGVTIEGARWVTWRRPKQP